jgi:hypothetical protein
MGHTCAKALEKLLADHKGKIARKRLEQRMKEMHMPIEEMGGIY